MRHIEIQVEFPAVAREQVMRPRAHQVLGPGRWPYVLSGALAAVAAVSAGFSLFVPSLLGGTDVTRGNLRGTALVVLALGVPALLLAMLMAGRGSARAVVVWLGATAYLLYQGVMFCFGTPMNRLFLAYVAMLGLGLWSLLVLLREVDVHRFAARVDGRMPRQQLAAVAGGFAALNGLAWLVRIVPAVFSPDPASPLEGSGLLTSPVWVQDLAFWVPASLVAAVWFWNHRPWGALLTGGMLAFYAEECLSIASDQWWGAAADSSRPDLASTSMVVPFLVLGGGLLAAVAWYLRHVDRAG